jgi:oligopeptide/dipeptide ABC transporter ATP-binding protein
VTLSERQSKLCDQNPHDFSDLRAVLFNTSLKKAEHGSHTRILLSVAGEIMARNGVEVEHVHAASHQIAYGVYPDMTEHGWDRDDWPALWEKVRAADILIVGTPIWLGEESSLCRVLIERLYGMSGMLNDKGQSIFYGKTGGAVVTGNEDGIKHCAMTILYALGHLGYTRALIDAVPIPDPRLEAARANAPLRGDLPSPLDLPVGCAFASRCPMATDLCRTDKPVQKKY